MTFSDDTTLYQLSSARERVTRSFDKIIAQTKPKITQFGTLGYFAINSAVLGHFTGIVTKDLGPISKIALHSQKVELFGL